MVIATQQQHSIRPRYKQTEAGVIPADWDVKRIGDIFKVTRGQVLSTREISKEKTSDYPFPVYSSQTKNNGLLGYYRDFLFENAITWTTDGANAGDVNFRSGKFYCTNVCGVLINENGYANICVAQAFNRVSKKYVSYVGNPKLMNNVVSDVIIAIPRTIKEQDAISKALLDIDALHIALESLIEKKKNIKQGTMHQLLTGKQRLPAFSGKWKVKTLLETTDCLDNLRVPLNESERLRMQGDVPYCGANGVLDYIDKYVIDDDIILIAEDGGYFDEYRSRPIAYRMTGKCWVNNHAHILKAKPSINQSFVFYSLVHKNILRFLASGTRAKLNKYEMYKIEISIPEDEKEQAAIATILSDMDTDIAALEARRDKAMALKKGMMQQLLTGNIRLI